MKAAAISEIIEKHCNKVDEVIAILQDLQASSGWLSEDTLRYVSEKLEVPLSRVYSLATFYKAFSLRPRGRHLITVCTGTTCHVRGAVEILEEIRRLIGIKPGRTTEDLTYSLETVNCVGACALGPVMIVDGKYFGKMTRKKVASVLEGFGEDK